MRKSKAKNKILQVAEEMFKQVGYANLNVNKIAYDAGVSIGTLYYHFPEGKISILMDIRRQIADDYKKRLADKLDSERLDKATSLNEGLEQILETLIGIHREERYVLAAMESEILSNLASYDKVAKSIVVEDLMESDARPVVRVLEALSSKHPDEGLALDGREAVVNKIIDVLIHRFVFVESMFGSEQDFIGMMIKILRALLS